MKILFLLLDAFRHDYINAVDTPFLYSKTREGLYVVKLRPASGFTQRTAIFTGATGDRTGVFTMHTFDAEQSPFAFLRNSRRIEKYPKIKRWWFNLSDHGPTRFLKELLARYYAYRRDRLNSWIASRAKEHADNAPVSHIPLPLLPEIGVAEDNRPIYLPGGLDQESIFDVFSAEKVPYAYTMYPLVGYRDQEVLDAVLEHQDSDVRVVLAQFTESDGRVHQCGPSSPERRVVTGEVDRKLRQIARQYPEDTIWIVFGDHGMTDVVEEIDLPDLLRPVEGKLGIKMGRDYLLFLDSTMARFRWVNERGKEFLSQVERLPALREKGKFLDEELARTRSIPLRDRRIGDLIWLANIGILIFPDYFHDERTHNRGMHGYDSNHDDMKSFLLVFGPGVKERRLEEANLIDVCPTLCSAAGVRAPRSNKGENLL